MLFKIPYTKYNECQSNLWKWLEENHPEPLHPVSNNHKLKYLGHYIGVQGDIDSPIAFQVYDLYFYEGSKFTGKSFIVRFGDAEADYFAESIEFLATLSNKDLKKTPTGEAYRRYKKRKLQTGIYSL